MQFFYCLSFILLFSLIRFSFLHLKNKNLFSNIRSWVPFLSFSHTPLNSVQWMAAILRCRLFFFSFFAVRIAHCRLVFFGLLDARNANVLTFFFVWFLFKVRLCLRLDAFYCFIVKYLTFVTLIVCAFIFGQFRERISSFAFVIDFKQMGIGIGSKWIQIQIVRAFNVRNEIEQETQSKCISVWIGKFGNTKIAHQSIASSPHFELCIVCSLHHFCTMHRKNELHSYTYTT